MRKYFLLSILILFSILFFACGGSQDHIWGVWKDNGDGLTHTRTCKNDFEYTETEDHVFDDGEILKQVSDLQHGEIKYTCEECGYSYSTVISPTGVHDFTVEDIDESKVFKKISSASTIYYKTCVDCGAYGNEEYLFEYSIMPEEYIELEYIEFMGNQYIDTGVVFNSLDCLPIKIETIVSPQTSIGKNLALAGCGEKRWYGPVMLNFYNNEMEFGSNGYKATKGYQPGIKTSFIANIGENIQDFYKDGKNIIKDTNKFSTSNNSLFIGNFNAGTPLVNHFYEGKLYAFKITCNENLIRDFVPVKIIKSREVGLYDLVTKRFFSNNHKLMSGEKVNNNTLPEGYSQTEYIESTGSQYINTGVFIEEKTRIETKVVFNQMTSHSMLYGAWDVFSLSPRSDCTLCVSGGGESIQPYPDESTTFSINVPYVISHRPESISINDNIFSLGDTSNTPGTGRQILLFAASDISSGNNPYNWGNFSMSKVYYFKIFNGDTPIRDMIPCIRDLDGKAGFYDLVSKEFFTYSEDFDVGNIKEDNTISNNYVPVEYIESSGTQFINLGVGFNNGSAFSYEITCMWPTATTSNGTGHHRASISCVDGLLKVGNVQTSISALEWHIARISISSGNIDENLIHSYYVDNVFVGSNTIQPYDSNPYLLFAMCSWTDNTGIPPYSYEKMRIGACKIYKDKDLIRDLIPCIRDVDGKPGFFDNVTQTFYSNENKTSFQGGQESGHAYDEGKVIKETTYYQDGDVVYTCRVCGKQIHKYEDKFAYKVTFNTDDGVETIKVFKDYNPSDFENSNSTYTRNKNTFNYSKIDSIVIFEIVLKVGYDIQYVIPSNVLINITLMEDGRYLLSNICGDLNINVITTKI